MINQLVEMMGIDRLEDQRKRKLSQLEWNEREEMKGKENYHGRNEWYKTGVNGVVL